MKTTFVAMVQRTSAWDWSKPPQDQPGFLDHVQFMGGLEAEGFIRLAGLLADTNEVLFVLHAENEAEVRARMADDPWLGSGLTRLARLEEANFRIWAPTLP